MSYVFDDIKISDVLSVTSWMLFSHAALLEHLRVCVLGFCYPSLCCINSLAVCYWRVLGRCLSFSLLY